MVHIFSIYWIFGKPVWSRVYRYEALEKYSGLYFMFLSPNSEFCFCCYLDLTDLLGLGCESTEKRSLLPHLNSRPPRTHHWAFNQSVSESVNHSPTGYW